MKHDLIERYVYAATKRLPGKNREDVSMELRSLIDDMLTERCGDETPTEKDIRVVLTELGTPMEIYAKYDEDADKCLIGQPYYSTYKFVLKIVLASTAIGMTIATMIQAIVEPTVWHEMISDWIGGLSGSLLSGFGFVTLLFAIFQQKGVRLNGSTNLDDLPTVPKKKQEISILDPVISIVIDILFVIIFLAVPHSLGVFKTETGAIVSIFHADAIRAHWYIIILFALFGIVRETVKLLEGRYNKKVMITTIITNVLSAVTAIWWLSDVNLFNPDFTAIVLQRVAANETAAIAIFERFPVFFLCVMLFALGLDTVEAVVKTLKK
jgi:hypothetical protein